MACRRAFSIAGNGTGRNYEHAIASASAQGHRRSADHRGEGGLQLADRAERPLGSATVERACGGHRPRAIDGRPRGAGLLRRDRGRFRHARFRQASDRRSRPAGVRRRRPRPADGPVRGRFRTVRAACRTDPHHRFRHDRPTAVPQRAPYARPPARLGRGADHQRKRFPRVQRDPVRRQRPSVRAHRQHRRRRRARPAHRRGRAVHRAAKRARLEAHLLCAERRGRAGEGSGRRNRLERRHRRHGHQNGGRARRRGVRHSRGVDMRVERRSRDDGRSGRHRVRADQRPRFVT